MAKKPIYQKLNVSFNLRIGEIERPSTEKKIINSREVADLCKDYARADREIFLVVMLNAKNIILSLETHTIGAVDSSGVYVRELFRSLLLKNATAFICVHNHPSGDPSPSECDKEITKKIQDAAQIMEIAFLDHVILGKDNYYSFADHGALASLI